MSKSEIGCKVAVVCFIVFFILVGFSIVVNVAYRKGQESVLNATREVELVYPSYKTGTIPCNVPIWAVYYEGGLLYEESAIMTSDGRLMPFAPLGEPIEYSIMPDPIGWTEISAGVIDLLN